MNSFKGYGFRPTEEELIGYLRDKTLRGDDYLGQDITDLGVDICKREPWDLARLTTTASSDPVWYFLYPITYKHTYRRNQKMIGMAPNKGPKGKPKPKNRATNKGRWKVSGKPVKVRASDSAKQIGVKTHLYFVLDNEEGNKTSKAKTPWVLYEYELTEVDPSKNIYSLGKLMLGQSKPTNKSSSKGETSKKLPSNSLGNEHIPTPEVQVGFDKEPLEEYNYNNWDQNQFSEQTTEFVDPCPVHSYGMYSELETSASSENEVTTNLQTSNLEKYFADYGTPQNLQEDLMDLIREVGVSNLCVGNENQNHLSFQNSVPIDNGEAERSDQHNIVAENKGFSLPNNFNNSIADIAQMVQVGFDKEPLVEMEVYSDYDWVQNPYSISEQATEFVNSCPVSNYEMHPEETSACAENEMITNLQRSNLENYVADYAIQQNLQEDLMDLIREVGVPNLCVGKENQNHQSFQNSVPINNGEAERSDQHNIVAENEGFSLPNNFNNSIADIAQMVQVGFDKEPLVEMEVYSDYDWVQNLYSISEQATEFVNSCPVSNYEMHPEETSACAENEMITNLQRSNLENYGADYAIQQNLQEDLMDLIREPEVSDLYVRAETQHYLSFQNPVPIDNGEAEEGINII